VENRPTTDRQVNLPSPRPLQNSEAPEFEGVAGGTKPGNDTSVV